MWGLWNSGCVHYVPPHGGGNLLPWLPLTHLLQTELITVKPLIILYHFSLYLLCMAAIVFSIHLFSLNVRLMEVYCTGINTKMKVNIQRWPVCQRFLFVCFFLFIKQWYATKMRKLYNHNSFKFTTSLKLHSKFYLIKMLFIRKFPFMCSIIFNITICSERPVRATKYDGLWQILEHVY